MNEEVSKPVKEKKKPAAVKYYGLISVKVGIVPDLDAHEINDPDHDHSEGTALEYAYRPQEKIIEIEADKSSELFAQLEEYFEPKILMMIRGRKINLTQKVSYKI